MAVALDSSKAATVELIIKLAVQDRELVLRVVIEMKGDQPLTAKQRRELQQVLRAIEQDKSDRRTLAELAARIAEEFVAGARSIRRVLVEMTAGT